MKLNRQILQINRNYVICFIVSSTSSAFVAHILSSHENYLNTTITVATGYVAFYSIFPVLFYIDNRKRYKQMDMGVVKKEVLKVASSMGFGEATFLATRWMFLYYFLELDLVDAFVASLASSFVAAAVQMFVISMLLRKAL